MSTNNTNGSGGIPAKFLWWLIASFFGPMIVALVGLQLHTTLDSVQRIGILGTERWTGWVPAPLDPLAVAAPTDKSAFGSKHACTSIAVIVVVGSNSRAIRRCFALTAAKRWPTHRPRTRSIPMPRLHRLP